MELLYRFTIAYDEKGIPDLQKSKVERFGSEAGIKNALGVVYNIKGVNFLLQILRCTPLIISRNGLWRTLHSGHSPTGVIN
jgi:hypothetical protein